MSLALSTACDRPDRSSSASREGVVDLAGSQGNTLEDLFAAHGPERPVLYWLFALLLVGAIAALPLIEVDVSVRAGGWIRPLIERTDLRAPVAGHLVEILARENDNVPQDAPLFVLSARDLEEALARNRARQRESKAEIADLALLAEAWSSGPVAGDMPLAVPALQAELAQLGTQLDAYRLAESKARTEMDRYARLSAKGIATQQEFDSARLMPPVIFHRRWLGPKSLPAEFAAFSEAWAAHRPQTRAASPHSPV